MTSLKFARRISILFIILLSLGGLSAHAQFSSGIEGTVQDKSGAVLPGAKVTVTDTRLGVAKTDTTNQSGYFRIDSIAASSYTVQIQMSGFKMWEQKDLTLQVGEIRTLSPALEVGSVATEITVSAAQAAINLTTPTTRRRHFGSYRAADAAHRPERLRPGCFGAGNDGKCGKLRRQLHQ